MKLLFSISVAEMLLLPPPAGATTADFSRYSVILNRRPFGDTTPADVAHSITLPETSTPSFIDSLRMVALTCSREDIRVGFIDSSKTPPKTYFLYVGELQDGIEVVSANYEEEWAKVRKDGEERTLHMNTPGRMTAETSRTLTGTADSGSFEAGSSGRSLSKSNAARRTLVPRQLSEGRRLRMEEERRRQETLPDLHGQVLEKHLQEYNMQAIRSGAPPLPIPLTEAQDAQLVSEGLLPSVESE